MLRPAGPRISSMMLETRSAGRYCWSRRSVASKLPISAPEADRRPTNCSSRLSTASASTVPSVDMTMDSWRSSSSSSSFHTFSPYCSPSASISTAARSGPVSWRPGPLPCCAWRPASVATRSAISVEWSLAGAGMAISSGRRVLQPLANDGDRLVRIAAGELSYFLDGLRVDLALHLRDVDRLGGLARVDLDLLGRPLADGDGGATAAGRERRHAARRDGSGRVVGRDDAANQRPYHEQHHDQAQQRHYHQLQIG